ncbi:MAG: D-alanyl-D-alanine carboxypeptidase family protein [Pseudomonadota bacterium]
MLALLALPAVALDKVDNGIPSEDDAPIAMLVDVTSGQVLHERNPNRRFVPASITKVMTMFLAFELIEEGKLDPAQVMTVPADIAEEWSGKGSTMFVEAGDRLQLADMLTAIANVSANDAAFMLARAQAGSVEGWTQAMTAKAHELEMTNSHFATPNGWPDGGGTFTTAGDLVKLARALVTRHPAKFGAFMGKPAFTYNGITQSNYDPLIGRIAGADGIKTGFTNEAGFGYLGTAKRDGQRLVMVIAGARSNGERARLSLDYIEWGFSAFDRQRIYASGETVGQARVQDGATSRIDLVTDRPVFVNVPANSGRGQKARPDIRITYDGPLRAPIDEGQQIAMLEITIPGMEVARVPLLAKESIGQAGFFTRIYNGFAGWFS